MEQAKEEKLLSKILGQRVKVKDENCEIVVDRAMTVIVCSKLSEDATLEWLNKNYPTGLDHTWGKSDYKGYPQDRPVPCSDDKTKTHFLFIC